MALSNQERDFKGATNHVTALLEVLMLEEIHSLAGVRILEKCVTL